MNHTDVNHLVVICPKGHEHRVSLSYFNRHVRKGRSFICRTCLTPFGVKKNERGT